MLEDCVIIKTPLFFSVTFVDWLFVSDCYHLQCLDYPYIWHIVNELLRRLSKFYEVSASTSECLLPIYKGPLPINEYFEVIDRHFEVNVLP